MIQSSLQGIPPNLRQTETQLLTYRQRQSLRLSLFKLRVREYLFHDSILFRWTAGLFGYLMALILHALGRIQREFEILAKLHRADFFGPANVRAERLAREAAQAAASGQRDHPLVQMYQQHIDGLGSTPRTAKFFRDPSILLGGLAMVLKSPANGEKGVILLQYSYVFPLFARLFNLQEIAKHYYIVLEPDWSGYCDPNILTYCGYSFPVFVQAYEPRDAAFVLSTNSNLIPVPTSTNWWVDHRLFGKIQEIAPDMDLVVVAGWGTYKRHYQIFSALRRLRRAGHRLKTLLLGYPISLSKEHIYLQASYHGVDDQLEIHENVPYELVNDFLNRGKVNLIWSRKEGVNREIVEGMFADVPCMVRHGFNYGYKYPYINEQTGVYASEKELPAKLLWMIQNRNRFSPRQWVMDHMTCQRAAELLFSVIGEFASTRGEPWSRPLSPKVNKLHGMEYWNKEDVLRYAPDYSFLRSLARV